MNKNGESPTSRRFWVLFGSIFCAMTWSNEARGSDDVAKR
jgi:hypothetical protein